jgi:hypothetical protein
MPSADRAATRLCRVAGEANAALAELTRLAADFDDAGHWHGDGIRSCVHWLTINTGVNAYTADEMLRVGHALRDLPQLRAAFEAGQLSLDKLRTVSRVATAVDEDIWVDLALHASGTQLVRICQGFTRAAGADTPDAANEALARRGVWTYWRDDGLLDLRALLPAEDGAIVLAAIEAAKVRLAERTPSSSEAPHLEPALDAPSARRADALVLLCEESSARSSAESDASSPPPRLVVHVDVGVLTSDDPQGRCHIEDGPGLWHPQPPHPRPPHPSLGAGRPNRSTQRHLVVRLPPPPPPRRCLQHHRKRRRGSALPRSPRSRRRSARRRVARSTRHPPAAARPSHPERHHGEDAGGSRRRRPIRPPLRGRCSE